MAGEGDEILIRIYARNELGTPIAEAKGQLKGLSDEVSAGGVKARAARKDYDSLGLGFSRVTGYATAMAKRVAGLAAVFGPLALGGAILHSVNVSNEFQAVMLRIQTQAGASAAEVRNMSAAVLGLAPKVGEGPVALADALYHIESVGYRGSDAMKILQMSAEAARISGANLDDTTYGLTSTMKSFELQGVGGAAKAMGMLNAIVGSGDMRMQDMNAAIQTGIMSTSQTFGVSLQSMGSALAFLTDRGEKANVASTRLAMGITMMAAPSKQAAKMLDALGMSAGDIKTSSAAMTQALADAGISQNRLAGDLRKPNGIYVALKDLQDTMLKNGISAQQSGDIIARIFGGARTGKAVMALVQNLDGVTLKYDQIGKMTGQFGSDWDATTKTTKQRLADLKSAFDSFSIKAGNAMRPVYNRMLDMGTHLLGQATTAFTPGKAQNPSSGIGQVVTPLKSIGTSAVTIAQQLEPAVKNLLRIGGTAIVVGLHALADILHVISDHGGTLKVVLYAVTAAMVANKLATIALATQTAISNGVTFLATLRTGGLAAAQAGAKAEQEGYVIGTRAMNAVMNSSLVTLGRTAGAWLLQEARLLSTRIGLAALKAEQIAVATGQKLLAAATWILNVAMDANPIMLVVIGLVALGAAVYEAYKHFGWFRDVVKDVFNALKGAVLDVIHFITDHWRAIVFITATVLLGPFGAIMALLTILIINNWHKIASFVTRIATDLWHVLVAIWHWIYRDVWTPVDKATRAVDHAFQWVGQRVSEAATWLWRQVAKVFGWINRDIVHPISSAFDWVYRKFSDAVGWLGSKASDIWKKVSGFFGRMRDDVVGIFNDMVTKIGQAWGKVEDVVGAPVRWVVDHAYNDGIKPVWNAVAGILHEKSWKLPDLHYAQGGIVPGNHNRDDVPIYTTPGEGVVNLRGMALLGKEGLAALNGHNGSGGDHFAGGGLVGIVKRVGHDIVHPTDAIGDLKHLALGALAAAAGPVLHGMEKLADGVLNPMGGAGQMLDQVVHNRADAFLDYLKGRDSSAPAGGGTVAYSPTAGVEQWRGIVVHALSMLGLSPTLADRVLKQMQTESGGNPNINQQIVDINTTNGSGGAKGLMQVIPPTFATWHVPGTANNIYDPLANVAAGLNYDMHKFGGNPGLVDLGQGHGYDSGGYLKPGWNLAYNGLGTREPVMPEHIMVGAIRRELGARGGSDGAMAPIVFGERSIYIENVNSEVDLEEGIRRGVQAVMREREERQHVGTTRTGGWSL